MVVVCCSALQAPTGGWAAPVWAAIAGALGGEGSVLAGQASRISEDSWGEFVKKAVCRNIFFRAFSVGKID